MTTIALTALVFRSTPPADDRLETRTGTESVLPSAPIKVDAPARSPRLETQGVRALQTRYNATTLSDLPARVDFQVMFSPVDAAAYRRLFENVGSMPYRLSSEPALEPVNKAMTEIDIAPLEIAPLDPSDDTGGLLK
jgi:hypothetical protein